MSLIRFAPLAVALVLVACGRPDPTQTEWPPKPTAEFLKLSAREQNLAVYDAFWKQIESNYYDPKFFATDEWRAARARWRDKAANVPNLPLALHNEVLRKIVESLPESHFGTQYPRDLGVSSSKAAERSAEQIEKMEQRTKEFNRLLPLASAGPGVVTTKVRRGNRERELVSDVWPGSLADEHDIQPGWRVIKSVWNLEVEDRAVHYVGEFVPLDTAGARAWERGESADATPSPADVMHVNYDLRKADLRKPFEERELAGGVHYVRLDGFGDEPFMRPVFEAVEGAGPGGLILDLRWNVGGLSEQQRKLAAVLLGSDALLGTTRERTGSAEYRTANYQRRYTGPLVVLVGPVTGSAAEIFAAAVQDHNRGRIIGRQTNGSVLEAQNFPLPDSGLVMVPIKNYFRAAGKRIEGVGVEPEIWILPTLEDVRAGRDPALERALQEITK